MEVLLSVAIFTIAGFAILFLVLGSFRGALVAGMRSEAVAYARESWEAVVSMGSNAYGSLANGSYGLSHAGGSWAFSGFSDTQGAFTRSVAISDVYRNGSGAIADTGTEDPHTRKVTTTVSWPSFGQTKNISFTDYFTNWDSTGNFSMNTSGSGFSNGGFSNANLSITDTPGAVLLSHANSNFWKCAAITGVIDLTGSQVGNAVASDGTYVYEVLKNNSQGGEFLVIDKTDITKPVVVNSLELGADVNSIAISGTYAYIGTSDTSNEFQVVNIAHPTTSLPVTKLDLPGKAAVLGVRVVYPYAYVSRDNYTAGPEFDVISINNLASMTIVGSAELGVRSRGLQIAGNYAYVITDDTSNEFQVINLNSLSLNMVPIKKLNFDAATTPTGIDIFQTNAYVSTSNNAGDAGEFFDIDIASSTNPILKGSLNLGNGTTAVVADGSNALIGTATANKNTYQVVDAGDATAPRLVVNQLLSKFSYNGLFWDATNKLLYVAAADQSAEFQILNRDGKANWGCNERKSIFDVPGNNNGKSVYAVGSKMYAGTGKNSSGPEFFVYNVPDPTATSTPVASFEANAAVNAIAVSGNYAYLATDNNTEEIKVVDLSTSPLQEVGHYNIPGNAVGQAIAVNGTTLLFTAGSTLYKFDVTDPTQLASKPIKSVDLGGTGYNMVVYDPTYVYVSTGNTSAKVQIVDYSQSTPVIVGFINPSGSASGQGLWRRGSQLMVSTSASGSANFYIYDITAPIAQPMPLLGSYNLGAASQTVVAVPDDTFSLAGVNRNGQEMTNLDISDPTKITPASIVNTLNGFVNSMYFANNTAYLATQDNSGEVYLYGEIAGYAGYSTGYVPIGLYDSPIFDAGGAANWNTAQWTVLSSSCSSGAVKIQVRTGNSPTAVAAATYGGYLTNPDGSLIDVSNNGNRYIQYRATLTSDQTCTPTLSSVVINYTRT